MSVTYMSDVKGDGNLWDVKQMLEHTLEGELPGKAIVLLLDDTDGEYAFRVVQAGMSVTQCIALCEVAKAALLLEVGVVEGVGT